MFVKRKGFSLTVIAALAVGAMALAAIVTAFTQGAFGQALTEGGGSFEEMSRALSGKILVEDEETLAAAARYSYDKAVECSRVAGENDAGGYPALSETVLGSQPSCNGFEASTAARGLGSLTGPGNDMEGEASRIDFEITSEEPIILKTGETYGSASPDKGSLFYLAGVSESENFYNIVTDSCGNYNDDTGIRGNLPSDMSANIFYFLGFEDGGGERTQVMGDAVTIDQLMEEEGHTNLYCVGGGQMLAKSIDKTRSGASSFVRVKLCKGDEGYIQVNKKKPTMEGDASQPIGGAQNLYPYIQITKLSDECEGLGEDETLDPYNGPTMGNTFRAEMNIGNFNWPGFSTKDYRHPFTLMDWESEGGLYPGDVGDHYEMTPPNNNECLLSIREREPSAVNPTPEDTEIYFSPGHKLDNDGFARAFTAYNNKYSDIDDKSPWDVYQKLIEDGLHGGDLDDFDVSKYDDRPMILSDNTGAKLRMYGDLLCLSSPETGGEAKWFLCSDQNDNNIDSIEIDGETWSCNPSEGEWSREGSERPHQVLDYRPTWYFSEDAWSVSEGDIMFDPGATDSWDRMQWRSLPGGEKNLTIDFVMKEEGLFAVKMLNPATEDPIFQEVGDFWTDLRGTGPDGNRNLWLETRGMEPEDTMEVPYDYDLDREYTLKVMRTSGGKNRYELWHGGSMIWGRSYENADFSRVVIEALENWNNQDVVDARTVIRDVSLDH